MQLLDVPNRCWSDEVLEKLDIDKALLPKVYESPEVTGVISEEAAKRTGLAAGTIVVGGAGDNAAAAVGTGVVEDGTYPQLSPLWKRSIGPPLRIQSSVHQD